MNREVTFLGHSGAAVRLGEIVLVFDCESGTLPDPVMIGAGQMVFFASHGHSDHFNAGIFEYGHNRRGVQYVLSQDIREELVRQKEKEKGLEIHWVEPRQSYEISMGEEKMQIRTLLSTDAGVAYLVTFRETVIYHAGDLNCWTWPGETEAYRENERAMYEQEIDSIEGIHTDIAFVPLDPRLEDNYRDAMDYFMKKVDAPAIWPIHMWGKLDWIDKYTETLPEEERQRIRRIESVDQCFPLGPRSIEVLLSRDETVFSWMTYYMDGGGLTHASITLDADAEFYYSFNMKGFKREYKTSLKRRPRDMVRFKLSVTEEQYQSLKELIGEMEADRGKYKYDRVGVMMRLLKLPHSGENDNLYYCSEFVAEMLDESGIIKMKELPGRMTPNDIGLVLGSSDKLESITVEPGLVSRPAEAVGSAADKLDKGKDILIDFTAGNLEKVKGIPLVPPVLIRVGDSAIEKTETAFDAASGLARKIEGGIQELPENLADKTYGLLNKASEKLETATDFLKSLKDFRF